MHLTLSNLENKRHPNVKSCTKDKAVGALNVEVNIL